MKKRNIVILSVVIALFALTTSVVLANSENFISNFFKEKNQKLESISNNDVIVKSDNFKITKMEYTDFREQLAFIHKLNDVPFTLDSQEIIDQMIEHELLLQYARDQNIEIHSHELKEYALQTQEAVKQSEIPEINEIHVELSKELNVSPDEYFTHPKVLEQYENALLIERAINQLYEDNKLNDKYTIDDFIKELKERNLKSIRINKSKIPE